jgi:phosphoribosyl 1,2-cyclic phosphodiesterase
VEYLGVRVLIDAGRDWRGLLGTLEPHAIVLTHAHADHVDGLRDGAPCPVWATAATQSEVERWPLDLRYVEPRKPFRLGAIELEAFTLEHSLRAPAVGYRVTAGRASLFYASDVAAIHELRAALQRCRLYVGDGATMVRPMVRKRGARLTGHAPVRAQLEWCAQAGVPRAVITHCGTGIVAGGSERAEAKLRELAAEKGVRAELAYDGMSVVLR